MTAIPVTVLNFVRVESDTMFARLAAQNGGVGVWKHFRELSPLDQQPIIRQNRDTLYSAAIVDLRPGVRVTVPDAGERYLSVMVVTQDHHIPLILHEGGEYTLTRDEIGSDFALLAARILVDPNDPADVVAVNALQDGFVLEGATGEFAAPEVDPASYATTRDAVLTLAKGLPDFRGAFGRRDEVDPVRALLGAAAGWGGLPEYEATYLNVDPDLPVGEYRLRLADVPVDAFWSVSLYNAEGFFQANDLGVNSINSLTAVADADGAVTIRFGTNPQGEPNYLPIMPGWNYLLRLYRPHPEVQDGTWQAPTVEPV